MMWDKRIDRGILHVRQWQSVALRSGVGFMRSTLAPGTWVLSLPGARHQVRCPIRSYRGHTA